MSTYLGRNAKLAVGENTVSEMMNWDITISADPIVEPTFGSTWTTAHGLATTGWTATANGLLDLTDSDGQVTLENAVISGTKLTNVRFYIDSDEYYTPDTGTDASAGCYVIEFSPGSAQGDVARVAISFQGSGPIHKTS